MTLSVPQKTTVEHAANKIGRPSPADQESLWAMEERFWTNGADNARTTTAKNAVMIFPYPSGILQGDQIWHGLTRRTGWRSVAMAERRAMQCGDIVILSYRASAEKPDLPIYEALCASTYLNDVGGWLRTSHQQTPVD
ncbi:hypothetical protein [Sedimentimonas flavescens]|uniref:hypothetical protein n=1 Tax=Sedimentimonas flavescens TaxID=2851012 RepID=UPI001F422A2D|nr:hypothetical protein [Sedimentimonas flavescens]